MRGLIIFLSVFVAFLVNGQVQFSDGMKWYSIVCGTHKPQPTYSTELVTLEKTDDAGIFKVFQRNLDHDTDREFVAFIKSDADKVYFKFDESETAEWYLMYDFGLQPGEGCYVYGLYNGNNNIPPRKTYVKCTSIEDSSEYQGWSVMKLEEYEDETCSQWYMDGTWIKDLASEGGLTFNNGFDLCGIGSTLDSVVLSDGTVVFSNPKSGISDISNSSRTDIRVVGHEIFVSAADKTLACLYTLTGLQLGNYVLGKSPIAISVPACGVYILKVGSSSKKIMVL